MAARAPDETDKPAAMAKTAMPRQVAVKLLNVYARPLVHVYAVYL